MQALRVLKVAEERIQSVEVPGAGIVVPRPQVLLAQTGVPLLAGVQQHRRGVSGGLVQGVAVRVVDVHLVQRGSAGAGQSSDCLGRVREYADRAVAIMQEVVRPADRLALLVVGLDGLADLVGAEGVVDDLDGGAALVSVRLADDLLVTREVPVVY